MSEEYVEKRNRNKTLFVVEGSGGEIKLLSMLARVFPELRINLDNVIVYKTNIYILYNDITKYYENPNWTDDNIDVDLPFMYAEIHKQVKQFSVDFQNIILIFDFDLQDPHFSKDIIIAMQKYFNEMTDKGKLFINYPMLESYLHFDGFDDIEYVEKTISTASKNGEKYNGGKYKDMVKRAGKIEKYFEYILSVSEYLEKENVTSQLSEKIITVIQLYKKTVDNYNNIFNDLAFISDDALRNKLAHYLDRKYNEMDFVCYGETYNDAIRKCLVKLIWITIIKSLYIQNELNINDIEIIKIKFKMNVSSDSTKGVYEKQLQMADDTEISYKCVDFEKILNEQLLLSENYLKLWVLNTSLLIVADYSSHLIMEPDLIKVNNH